METPDWFNGFKAVGGLDARPLIAAGGHPLSRVLIETVGLKPGEYYELITPFRPMPLLEKMQEKGFDIIEYQPGTDEFRTYICKR